MNLTIPVIGPTGHVPTATATDANQGDSIVKRDASGNCTVQDLTVAGLVSGGGARPAIATKTANYTATAADRTILVDATGGARTITLPAVATHAGQEYVIKKIDATANAVTIDGDGSDTIDGAATLVLAAQWDGATIQNDGSAWYVLAPGA